MKSTSNKRTGRDSYVSPSIEIIRMENEGVIAASGSTENYTPTTMSLQSTPRSLNSASSNDLEDLISDIFTVEN